MGPWLVSRQGSSTEIYQGFIWFRLLLPEFCRWAHFQQGPFSYDCHFKEGLAFWPLSSLFLFFFYIYFTLINRPFLDNPKNLLNECHHQRELWLLCTPNYSVSSNRWCIPTHCQVVCLPVSPISGLVMELLWLMAWKPTEFTPQSQLIWLSHCHKNDQAGSQNGKTSGTEPQLVCRCQHECER